MPVLRLHQPQKRSDTGLALSIVFGIVTGLVLLACFIWGFALPWLRKRCARKSTKNQWTDSIDLTTRRRNRLKRTYPSHPAVRPLLSKPSATNSVTFYDPRTESPFTDNPAPPTIRFASTRNLRAQSTPPLSASTSSNGLFTPVKRSDTENDDSKSRFHTVPRATDARHVPVKSFDFGDAKDFILAVPEPLALKPRDADRPPPVPVVRHFDKYNTSITSLTTSPAHSDKHLHPNKLFRSLTGPDIHNSFCSSTSLRIDHRQSDAVTALPADDVADTGDKTIHEDAGKPWSDAGVQDEAKKEDSASTRDHSQNKELANVHRFRSYQSLTAEEPVSRTRAGTLTRPKTPAEDLRTLYNEDQQSVTLPSIHFLHRGAASTQFGNTDFGSDYDSFSTPATSPVMYPSNTCLLPTPLNLKKSFEPESGPQCTTSEQDPTNVSAYHEQSASNIPSILISDRARSSRDTRGFYHTGRRLTKPAPLNIRTSSKETPLEDSHSRRSSMDFGQAVFGPLLKTNTMRSRARASSLYSRDTHGISMVNTPITPDFPTPGSGTFTDQSVCGNPFMAPESVKARIDDWTQRIESRVAPPLPPIRHVSPFFAASRNTSKVVLENPELDTVETDAGLVAWPTARINHGEKGEEYDIGTAGGAKWI